MHTAVRRPQQPDEWEREHGKKTHFPVKSPSKHLRVMGTARILQRIRSNDEGLHCLVVEPELLLLPDIGGALLQNTTIHSVILVRLTPKIISEAVFARFMECLYHLPLRTLQAGGNLKLPNAYLSHVLHLVEYCCGVGGGCSWSLTDNNTLEASYNAASIEATTDATEGEMAAAERDEFDRKVNAELHFVDLSGNAFTVFDAMRMGNMLFHHRSSLRRVNLSECRLGNKGVQALLQQANKSLRLNRIVPTTTTTTENTCGDKTLVREDDVSGDEAPVPLELLELRWNGITEDNSLRSLLHVLEKNDNNAESRENAYHCTMCVDVCGNYLSPALYSRLTDRMSKLLPLLKAREKKRRDECRQLLEVLKNKEKQQQAKKRCRGVLEFLLSFDDDKRSSLPSLSTLVSMMIEA